MADPRSILIVDDDEIVCERLSGILGRHGYRAVAVGDAEAALESASRESFDAFFVDIGLPDIDGFELMGRLRELESLAPIVIITAHGNLSSAVTALRCGAFDFLTKPVEPSSLQLCLERIFQINAVSKENVELRGSVGTPAQVGSLIGHSDALLAVASMVRRVANSSATVLITGESGTGKDVVARALHEEGAREQGPFLPINCAAIPSNLLESELFGHAKGAFTGAATDRVGLFEAGEGGTVFLDEVAEMEEALQAKLLRFLQDREVRRVGANEGRRVDVRVVAATNRDLREEIAGGRFRKDLYYRLNVIPIRIPPLRERPEDILPLAEFFVKRHGGEGRRLGVSAVAVLEKESWPGNARELENTIERSLTLTDADVLESDDLFIDEQDLAPLGDLISTAAASETSLRKLEDLYIDEILKRVDGNKNHAAKILGVNRTTLYRREGKES